jgi:aryl-alcohol dehydrogenase-like predicted oxidoreductase
MATGTATWDYRDRFSDRFGRTYFRRYADGVVSSIGLGTYLGEPTDERDADYRAAIETALESGCNVVDTAINYRCQRSERVVGEAVESADVERGAVLVATKGGFVPFDGSKPADPGRYVREEFLDTGILRREDLARGSHAIAPEFVENQFERSRSNLGVETVDLYYVHNPETQLAVRSRGAVYDQLEASFRRLEERVAAGELRHYGVATWEAFRVLPGHDSYLSLPEVVSRARSAAAAAGNDATAFRAVQVPFNVVMADAFTVDAHEGTEGPQSVLSFAHDAGLNVFASAPLAQGDLLEGLPQSVAAKLEGEKPVHRAINFARSAPGVTSALVGMGSPEHVAENLEAGEFDPLGARAFDRVFE